MNLRPNNGQNWEGVWSKRTLQDGTTRSAFAQAQSKSEMPQTSMLDISQAVEAYVTTQAQTPAASGSH